MIGSFSNLTELVMYFDTDAKCLEFLEQQRWGNEVFCPHCGNSKTYRFSDGKRFKCASCREQFTAKVGTIFEDSKISLKKWYIAIYLVISNKKGISSHHLAKEIKVTQKTAWFMLQRIRFALGMDNNTIME
jgi:transposase-like protein